MGIVKPVGRRLCSILLGGLMVAVLAGCGGGGDGTGPTITSGVVTTNPTPVSYNGAAAHVSVVVSDVSGVDRDTVKVEVVSSTGASLTTGAQIMSKSITAVDTYFFDVTLPNNLLGSADVAYTFKVWATDLKGNAVLSPAIVGTVTVPKPPAPPGGP